MVEDGRKLYNFGKEGYQLVKDNQSSVELLSIPKCESVSDEVFFAGIPKIDGAKGYAGVLQPPVFSGVFEVAKMHSDPKAVKQIGRISAKGTTARPLAVVIDKVDGIYYLVDLKSGEFLGIGETPEEAKTDAIANDPEMRLLPSF